MNATDLRVEALRLAVATLGNSNKVQVAEEYLAFLTLADAGTVSVVKKGKKG